MPSSAEIAQRNRNVNDYNAPRTEYVLRLRRGTDYTSSDASAGNGAAGGKWRARVTRTSSALGNAATQTNVPRGVPAFLGNQQTVIYAWVAAMGVIVVDEWKNNHIIARPSRLWWASLFYGLLAVAGMTDALIPLVNVFAIGYLITLLWQYYNGEGQFK